MVNRHGQLIDQGKTNSASAFLIFGPATALRQTCATRFALNAGIGDEFNRYAMRIGEKDHITNVSNLLVQRLHAAACHGQQGFQRSPVLADCTSGQHTRLTAFRIKSMNFKGTLSRTGKDALNAGYRRIEARILRG
jgi:hypothetical protein